MWTLKAASNLVHAYFTFTVGNFVMYVVEAADCASVFLCIYVFLERQKGERNREKECRTPGTQLFALSGN